MNSELTSIISSLKGKKVAFFHSHILWPSHFETELELIELLKNEKPEIINYVCNDTLKSCDHSAEFNLFTCSSCISRRKKGFSLISGVKEIPVIIDPINFEISPEISIDEFLSLKYQNFDFGYAVMSTMISRTRNPYIKMADHFDDFRNYVNSSLSLYKFFIQSLETEKPDCIFIFNGRFTHARALLRAAEFHNIPFYTHERGANKDKFMLFNNTMPHNLNYFHENIIKEWNDDNTDINEKIRIATEFYTLRRNGNPKEWVSFIGGQVRDLLPDKFDKQKHNIGIYLSSEDEYSAIGDAWVRPLFNSQVEALKYIFAHQFEDNDIHFYIRMHPNSANSKIFQDEISQFANDHITIIDPLSPVSTYHLLENVNKVITFGSTIGIEATFWDKVSINLDNALYYNLTVCYNPSSKESIIEFILDKNLKPLPKENTYSYGYYMSVFGYDYSIYKPIDFGSGTYKNVKLNEVRGIKYRKVKKFKYFPTKWSKKINFYRHRLDYFFKTRF